MSDTLALLPVDWDALDALKFADEEALLERLIRQGVLSVPIREAAVRRGRELVSIARSRGRRKGMMESFLEEFGLTNFEGLALMCLAEALLRVPDAATKDDLIAEKIRSGHWGAHQGQSGSWLVNASTWGLMLTGRVIGAPESAKIRSRGRPCVRSR